MFFKFNDANFTWALDLGIGMHNFYEDEPVPKEAMDRLCEIKDKLIRNAVTTEMVTYREVSIQGTDESRRYRINWDWSKRNMLMMMNVSTYVPHEIVIQ